MTLVRQAGTIAAKDLRIELRGRHALGTILPFAATLLIAFGLSIGPGRTLLQQTAPGLLWLAMLFASVLAFQQSYDAEGEDAALQGLLLAPVDKAAVFLGKAAAVAVQLVALWVAVLVLVAALFDVSLGGDAGVVVAACLLGTIGLAAVGSLFGVLTESPRAREAVVPLLVLPLAVPVLLSGVKATSLALVGLGSQAGGWIGLLVAFDVVFLSAGMLVFEHLMED
jgi:heme exporter protein B